MEEPVVDAWALGGYLDPEKEVDGMSKPERQADLFTESYCRENNWEWDGYTWRRPRK